MDANLFAHTPAAGSDEWHGLVDHLEAVASKAGEFGAKFGASDVCSLLGLCHDLGKANPKFQEYLRLAAKGISSAKVPHAAPGAKAAEGWLGPFMLAVLGHHRGLPNRGEVATMIGSGTHDAVEAAEALMGQLALPKLARESLQGKGPLEVEMLIRMVFSALVDADYLDTESHFAEKATAIRGQYPGLETYRGLLAEHMEKFLPIGPINQHRAEILESCMSSAGSPQGFFDLQVPTGGGKTLAGLAFALEHAVVHSLDRIILAIPYTSIIDQTAAVYKGIFGEDAVLEHHSSLDFDEADGKRKLAAENWDCPLVVTTTVQLFESLLSHKPSRCRKLHNIARSVIILDEVQTLPPQNLGPIMDVLGQLVDSYGCSVVLSTATLPDLSVVSPKIPKSRVSLVPDFERHYEALRRVEYLFPKDAWNKQQVAEAIVDHDQILAVFNSRKDALEVAKLCGSADGVSHLSTLLCGDHRKRIIKETRQRLQEGQAVRLISTQVIEAGVDVDFPAVYRVLGPLDRIIQSAGRCNREGRLDGLGRCTIIKLEDGGTPKGAYLSATAITESLLDQNPGQLDSPETIATYSRELFRHTETGSLHDPTDRAPVQKLREMWDFETVSHAFRMVDHITSPVIVEKYPYADVSGLLDGWQFGPRGWFRKISRYTVSLYDFEIRKLQDQGLLRKHESGAWIYSGHYDELSGISPEISDSADLVL